MARYVYALLFGLLLISPVFHAAEDPTDDEGDVEDDDDTKASATGDSTDMTGKDADEENVTQQLQPSPDVEITMIFTKPAKSKALPSGGVAKFLAGFMNKGDKDFVVNEMSTSLRYPQDFSFVIQNYTAAKYARTVEAGHEGTFDYAFVVSESYAGRPLGLYVSMLYTDSTGKQYQHTVFNDTITVVEDDSFSHETGFLYFVFACLVIIGLLLGQQFLTKLRRRAGISASKSKMSAMTNSKPMETGTNGNGDVDMSWIPREVQQSANKSPGRSPNSNALKRREQKAKRADE